MSVTDAPTLSGSAPVDPPETLASPSARSMVLAVGIVVAAAVAFVGHAVPFENEHVYLLRLRAVQDPSFLRGDWTFDSSFTEHLLFNRTFAPFTAFLSTEVLGWTGRLACWAILAFLLIKLAGRMGATPFPAAVALAVFIPCQLRLVGADWVFGTFEAKPVSYMFLFGALLFATRGSVVPAIALCGVAFAFHPGVGLWGAPPLVLALMLQPATRREALRWCWLAALLALPGVAGVLLELRGTQASNEFYESFVKDILPFHLDPFYFGVPVVLVLVAMFAFSVSYHLVWVGESRVFRLLGVYQLLLAIPFVGGVLLYLVGSWNLLKFFPSRVFPVMTGLLFVLDVARIWGNRRELWATRRSYPSAAVLGGAVALVIVATITLNVPKQAAFSLREVYRSWTAEDDDLDRALRWVSDNVPEEAVVVMPPGRQSTFYLAERPQVANVKAVAWERITEWHERITDMLGESVVRDADALLDEDEMEEAYDQLTVGDVEHLQEEYGAEYLVGRADYDFEVLHRDGDYKVYALP